MRRLAREWHRVHDRRRPIHRSERGLRGRWAKVSARYMLALREDHDRDDCDDRGRGHDKGDD